LCNCCAAVPDAEVTSDGIFDTEVQLFRARSLGAQGLGPELAVSYEAFEDHSAEEIVAALERHHVAKRLRDNPGERLLLDRRLGLRPVSRSARA
jgi:hypothetical protein